MEPTRQVARQDCGRSSRPGAILSGEEARPLRPPFCEGGGLSMGSLGHGAPQKQMHSQLGPDAPKPTWGPHSTTTRCHRLCSRQPDIMAKPAGVVS